MAEDRGWERLDGKLESGVGVRDGEDRDFEEVARYDDPRMTGGARS